MEKIEDVMGTVSQGAPGTILTADRDSVLIACGEGALRVLELQLEGKKRMSTHDFLLGVKMEPGERLGD